LFPQAVVNGPSVEVLQRLVLHNPMLSEPV